MPLAVVEISPVPKQIPQPVEALIRDAQSRIDQFVDMRLGDPIVAFVPSDFGSVQQALIQIAAGGLAPGRQFVEWGCGMGVATCLAALLDFNAVGIEIEPDLVELSRSLATDHRIDAQFVRGSFLPPGAEELVDMQAEVAWLRTDGPDAYAELGLEPDDFDVVFGYPWPGEEQILFDLFERYSATGALLLTFHGQEGIRLHRKVSS